MGGCKASSLQVPWIRGLFFGDGDVARLEMSGRLAMLNVSFALSTVWKKMKRREREHVGRHEVLCHILWAVPIVAGGNVK